MIRILCCAGMLMLGLAGPGLAADYPSRPIRLMSGYPPGAGTDYAARIIAEALTSRLGQSMVVESKPGAGSEIALDYVAKAPPDGYTLVFANEDATAMAAAEKTNLSYRIPEDFSYISRVVEIIYTYAVNPKLPITSVAELVAYAKAHPPGTLRYGSAGVGSAGDVARLLLQQEAGITMTHVPYRGGSPAMVDTLSGVIDLSFQTIATIGDQAKAGKIRLIVNTSEKRDALIPDVPTMVEAGYPKAVMTNWLGIMGPAKLPADVLARLRSATAEALADPVVQARFAKLGFQPSPLAGDAFQKLVTDQLAEFRVVLKQAHFVME